MNKEIIECIKIFNVGSTIKRRDQKNANYNSELNINYDENINIGAILDIFINQYLNFKEEYNKLVKLSKYEDLCFTAFSDYENSKILSLEFFDDNKTIESRDGHLLLSLEENAGVYSSYVYNDLIGTEFKQIEENIDPELVKQHIDLFKKYKMLCESYNFFKKIFIFGNGYNVLYINIDGEILDNLNSFEIEFGNAIGNKDMFISLKVEISNKSKFIDKKIILQNKEINPTSEIINYILKNTYLNKEYLPQIYRENKTISLEDSQKIKKK